MSIDLHLHTTASDGRLAPAALVRAAADAGVEILAVTDHDTTAGFADASAEAARAAVRLLSGIEISASQEGADVHLLGYFFDPNDERLQAFLAGLREARVRRLYEMGARLAALGVPVDVDAIASGSGTQSLGRPQLADALVAAGHVASVRQAFDRYLATGRPAYVARVAVPPERVMALLHEAGGIVSLAHPGLLRRDEWIGPLAGEGLDALEVYHSDHPPDLVTRYRDLAARLGLGVTGGSDFHASTAHGGRLPGSVVLPPEDFARLEEVAGRRSPAR